MAMAGGATCRFRDHREVKSYSDLWPCVQDNICPIADDREQMVVFRDPRPQVKTLATDGKLILISYCATCLRKEQLEVSLASPTMKTLYRSSHHGNSARDALFVTERGPHNIQNLSMA